MKIFTLLLFSLGCAAHHWQPETTYCGQVGTLGVFVERDSVMDCSRAIAVTSQAAIDVAILAGPISTPWRVVFIWSMIDVSGTLAQTDSSQCLIRVRERRPENLLHELLHARIEERGEHLTDDHRIMCERGWDCRQ